MGKEYGGHRCKRLKADRIPAFRYGVPVIFYAGLVLDFFRVMIVWNVKDSAL